MRMENAKLAFVTFDSADVITTSGGSGGGGGDTNDAWWITTGTVKDLLDNSAKVEYGGQNYVASFTGYSDSTNDVKWGIYSATGTKVEPFTMNFTLGGYNEEIHKNEVTDQGTLQQALEWLKTNSHVDFQ